MALFGVGHWLEPLGISVPVTSFRGVDQILAFIWACPTVILSGIVLILYYLFFIRGRLNSYSKAVSQNSESLINKKIQIEKSCNEFLKNFK